MQVPTGGTAREPKGRIRCNSGADSIVWMEEDESCERTEVVRYMGIISVESALGWNSVSGFFCCIF